MGFVKISRSIKEWGWYDDPNTLAVWIHLLVDACWKDSTYSRGEDVQRGTLVTSVSRLSSETGLTDKQVRTCLDKLCRTGEIVKEGASKWTKITICNYALYQDCGGGDGQTNGEQMGKQAERSPCVPPDGSSCTSSLPPNNPPKDSEETKKEKEVDAKASTKKEATDFDLVIEMWNSSATRSIPKVKGLTPARREKVKLRIAEMGGWEKAREILAECFKKISESDFCTGATGKWTATFDWFFVNEKNWLKVLEGNYDNRKEKTQLEQLAENISKAHEYYGQRYGYGGASAYGDKAGGRKDSPDEQ